MSAIYGLFRRNGAPASADEIALMGAAMGNWVADCSDCRYDSSVGLGHLMLYTTAESRFEQLPRGHASLPGVLITADARLDNRAELFAALAVDDAAQREIADSTLILLAYAKWGTGCVARLLGDFAFVIWDGVQRVLFCARDHMGVKPFFYHLASRLFLFGSDIKAILAHPAVPRRLHEPLLRLFLDGDNATAEKRHTFFSDVLKLPPAHWLTVSSDEVHLERYWSLEQVPDIRLASAGAYEERLHELLVEAVSCRLRSAFPIGSHLSGGLDSSTVTVLAARLLRQRGELLSAAFAWSPAPAAGIADDERQLIAAICTAENISCEYLDWSLEHGVEVYERDFTTQPTEMLLRELLVQRQAAHLGIRIMLSGWGGDEGITFNGRGYLAELLRSGRLRTLSREISAVIRSGNAGRLRRMKRYLATIYSSALEPLLPDTALNLLQQIWPGKRSARGYAAQALIKRTAGAAQRLAGPAARARSGVHANQRMLIEYGHLTRRTESWAINGAQLGIEYRYPLLDRRILEFALGIPADQYFQGGWKRYLFRCTVGDILPDEIRWHRSKEERGAFAVLDSVMPQVLPELLRRNGVALLPQHSAAEYVDVIRLQQQVERISGRPSDIAQLFDAISFLSINYTSNTKADELN